MRLKQVVGWAGGLAAVGTLACLFQGIGQGLKRPAGRTTGPAAGWLRRPAFYLAMSLGYFGLGAGLWRPLPLAPPPWVDGLLLWLGTLLYFPGLALMVWGRLALGRMYFVSLTGGTQLFAGHRLITHGPFAYLRHPMYLGLLLAGLGGTLIYRTWTWVLVTLSFLGVARRARLEERALADEFGAEWQAYARRVPAWLPRLRREG
jgi:protein-S-isoprenylcysteine O-methyltransferase Ste14